RDLPSFPTRRSSDPGEGTPGGSYGSVDVRLHGKRQGGDHLLRRRVDHVDRFAAGRLHPHAVDVELVVRHRIPSHTYTGRISTTLDRKSTRLNSSPVK